MVSAEDGVQLIRSESHRIASYLEALPPDALEKPSYCDGWTIAELVAHVAWVAQDYYGAAVAGGLRGDTSFPEGLSRSSPADSASSDATMAQIAIERRQNLGDRVIPAFREAFDQFTGRLTGIGPEDWEKPIYHPTRVRTVESYVPGMLQELTIHDWDIRWGLEPSPSLSPAALQYILPYSMERIPGRAFFANPFRIGAGPLGTVCYRFKLTGNHPSASDIVVETETARLEVGGQTAPNLQLTCDADVFLLLMYGRFTLGSAIAAGRMTAEGDQGSIPDFDRWLRGD